MSCVSYHVSYVFSVQCAVRILYVSSRDSILKSVTTRTRHYEVVHIQTVSSGVDHEFILLSVTLIWMSWGQGGGALPFYHEHKWIVVIGHKFHHIWI